MKTALFSFPLVSRNSVFCLGSHVPSLCCLLQITTSCSFSSFSLSLPFKSLFRKQLQYKQHSKSTAYSDIYGCKDISILGMTRLVRKVISGMSKICVDSSDCHRALHISISCLAVFLYSQNITFYAQICLIQAEFIKVIF